MLLKWLKEIFSISSEGEEIVFKPLPKSADVKEIKMTKNTNPGGLNRHKALAMGKDVATMKKGGKVDKASKTPMPKSGSKKSAKGKC